MTDANPPSRKTPPARRRRWRPHALPVVAQPGVLAAVWALLLIYGSLLPFDLEPAQYFAAFDGFWPGLLHWLSGPGWVSAQNYGGPTAMGFSLTTVDLATNLALYAPLGAMLRIALRRRGLHWTLQIVLASCMVFALSWLMECAQAWSSSRVGSLYDVAANVGCGVFAVVLAPWLWATARHAMFIIYCRLARPIHALHIRLRFLRRSPRVMLALVLLNAVLLTGWYTTQALHIFAGPNAAHAKQDIAMPFERHFAQSYDTAAVLLGRSMLVYAALGTLLALMTLHGGAKRPLARLVVAVLAVALGIEFYRWAAAPGSFRADLTEPLIALSAALLIGITTYLFAHAVRRTNRRHEQAEYAGPDRRRVQFKYDRKAES